jgi:pimeloyl-ACP methyl ester carboxylesterase
MNVEAALHDALPARDPREYPVVIPAVGGDLCGVFADPGTPTNETAVLLLVGGGFIPMTHRNRMWVRLSRRLVNHGCPVLRFDYHGIGESKGATPDYVLDRPFVEDVEGAVQWLRGRGVTQIVMVGSCFGARAILAAGERVPELYAAALLSPPLRRGALGEQAATRFAETLTVRGYLRKAMQGRVLRRLRDPQWRARYWRVARVKLQRLSESVSGGRPSRKFSPRLAWVSEAFLRPVQALPHRGVRLCFMYGDQEAHYEEFQRAREAGIDELFQGADGLVEVRTVAGVLHGFTTCAIQDRAIDEVSEWILQLPIGEGRWAADDRANARGVVGHA